MISNRRHFEVAFPQVPEPVADVWSALTGFLAKGKALPRNFTVSQLAGHPAHLQSETDLTLTAQEIYELIQ